MAEVVRELVARMTFEVDASGADKFGNAVEKAGSAAEGAGVKTVALGNIVAGAAKRLTDFALNAAKQAVTALQDIVLGSAEAADEIAKMSKQLNVDAEQLQRLRGAADLSGASIQDMNRGIRALTVGLADAKLKGTGPVIEGFDAIGVSLDEVESLLNEGQIEEAMGLIGDSFNATGDSAEKNAALLKIFGARAGSQLRPLLESGTAGITEMGNAIQATGEVIDSETLPTFEKMQDDLRLVQGAVTGAKNQISAALAPVVSDIAAKFTDWIAENQDFINQDLPEIIGMIAEALQLVLPWVIDVITEFKNFTKEIGDLDERLEQDFGPTWVTIRDILWKVLDPLETILEYLGAIIDKADKAIGRFRTVGALAAEAAGDAEDGLTTDERGGVGFQDPELERARQGRIEDEARIRGAEAAENADRERAEREREEFIESTGREILRGANTDKRKITKAELARLEEAGATGAYMDSLVKQNAGRLARGKKTGGGGGRSKRSAGAAESAGTTPTIDDLISNVGASASSGRGVEGGGGGPGLGGTFNTIDASYNASTTVTIQIPANAIAGLPAGMQGDAIANRIREVLQRRDREAFDHYAGVLRD